MHKLTQTQENFQQWFHNVDVVKLFLCSRKICSVKKKLLVFCFGSHGFQPHYIKYGVAFNSKVFHENLSYFLSRHVKHFLFMTLCNLSYMNNIFHNFQDEYLFSKVLLKTIFFYLKTFPLFRCSQKQVCVF